ncbi:MAG: hypothetical protein F6K31_38085 [Symploca sp. SIO2G7]|nr:hypothetical protein [Symploca sp. SIO2G7]
MDLFLSLKDAGLPLGMGEYQLALQALQAGFGVADRGSLSRLCRTLWVKSPDEARIFEYYFEQFFPLPVSSNATVSELSMADRLLSQKKPSQDVLPQEDRKPSFKRRLFQVGIPLMVVAGFTIAVRIIPRQPPTQPSVPSPITSEPSTSEPSTFPPSIGESPQSDKESGQAIFDVILVLFFIIGLYFLFFICVFVVDRIGAAKRAKLQTYDEDDLAEPFTTSPEVILSSELIRELPDEIQVAKTMRQFGNSHASLVDTSADYLPATRRQMKQSWRYLRHFARQGLAVELDVEATVKQIGQQGMLLHPVLLPRRINLVELLLLIDRDGSMIPFHSFAERLVETAVEGSRLGQVNVYYFHNCPTEYLYRDPVHQEAVLIEDVVSQLRPSQTVVLILSDAGAARGGFNPRRRRLIKRFVNQLQPQVRHIAWLNPIPRSRWAFTTAKAISEFVPMFEINRQGMDAAIDSLRGRYQISR